MLKKHLAKLLTLGLIAVSTIGLSPIGASAEWRQDSKGWWFSVANSWFQSWANIDSTWYYFGEDGYMKTGWSQINSKWYYFGQDGGMKTGWVKDNSKWYYLGEDGSMKTGWLKDNDGKWYYLTSPSGQMVTDTVKDRCRLDSNGAWIKKKGWFKCDPAEKYYFEEDGYAKTGWFEVDGDWYYGYPDGDVETNTTRDGYTLDYDGVRCTTTGAAVEARNLVLKEDSKYIKPDSSNWCTLYKRYREGTVKQLLGENTWNIPDEEVYEFNLFDSKDEHACSYLVGKTSKNIYCIPHGGNVPAYQIKNNQVVKTFEWVGSNPKKVDWRNQ